MKRATIHAMLTFDIEGEDDEQIAERFADSLGFAHDNVEGIHSITCVSSETIDRPFDVPKGAERWAAFAEIRLDEDGKRAAMHDGSWWWTNGHVMLRCDGDPPEGWRRIENALANEALYKLKQLPTSFGEPIKEGDGYEKRIASTDDKIAIQTQYYDRIAAVIPEARWTCTRDLGPIRAFDGDKLMAIVMPVKRVEQPSARRVGAR